MGENLLFLVPGRPAGNWSGNENGFRDGIEKACGLKVRPAGFAGTRLFRYAAGQGWQRLAASRAPSAHGNAGNAELNF